MQLFWPIYFVLMNLAALYLMYSDKQKAIKKNGECQKLLSSLFAS